MRLTTDRSENITFPIYSGLYECRAYRVQFTNMTVDNSYLPMAGRTVCYVRFQTFSTVAEGSYLKV
jgi:hypothetical protein